MVLYLYICFLLLSMKSKNMATSFLIRMWKYLISEDFSIKNHPDDVDDEHGCEGSAIDSLSELSALTPMDQEAPKPESAGDDKLQRLCSQLSTAYKHAKEPDEGKHESQSLIAIAEQMKTAMLNAKAECKEQSLVVPVENEPLAVVPVVVEEKHGQDPQEQPKAVIPLEMEKKNAESKALPPFVSWLFQRNC